MAAARPRVFLDACVPRRLNRELAGFEVRHATDLGWADLDDGALLVELLGVVRCGVHREVLEPPRP